MKKLILLSALLIFACGFGQEFNSSKFKEFMANQYNEENIIKFRNLSNIEIPFTTFEDYTDINYVPALVNGVYDYFIFDTGCTYGLAVNSTFFDKILINSEVFEDDFIGASIVQTAVGNYQIIKVFIIGKVVIGKPNKCIELNNVLTAVYDSSEGPLLLGQDIINRFSSITIDNKNEAYNFKKN
tara:strand:+ start:525 stop:1076 length:552 start_codon:yes stop_codon:yes gene_type:complete